MKEDLSSFLNELCADEHLQQTLRETTSAQALVEVGSSRGYRFTEPDLISHLAETLILPNDDLASFLKKLSEDNELQERLRPITTAEGVVAVAAQVGYQFKAPELIRHFAETLVHADDPPDCDSLRCPWLALWFPALGPQAHHLIPVVDGVNY